MLRVRGPWAFDFWCKGDKNGSSLLYFFEIRMRAISEHDGFLAARCCSFFAVLFFEPLRIVGNPTRISEPIGRGI
jgi:hypothetical protein